MDKLLSRTSMYSSRVYSLAYKIKELESDALRSDGEVKRAIHTLIAHKRSELEKEIHLYYKESLAISTESVDESIYAETLQSLATIKQ